MVKHILLTSLFVAFITPTKKQTPVTAFELDGSAAVLGKDCIRLTPDVQWASGSAWAKDAINLDQPFDLEMSLVFGQRDELGADGIVFVLAPTRRTGWRGEGLGFLGLRDALGIEFDTYQNYRQNDPVADHLALVTNGFVAHRGGEDSVVELPNLEDGKRHPVRVTWNPTDGKLNVFVDGVLRATYPEAVVRGVFGNTKRVYWGLTASTGRKTNAQDVCFKN